MTSNFIGVLNRILFLAAFCFFLTACSKPKNEETKTSSREAWLKFVGAMESKDVNYLLANSRDSLLIDEKFYPSKIAITTKLEHLMQLSSLSEREFTVIESDEIIRVIYPVKIPKMENGGYNLVFSLERKENSYKLLGNFIGY